MHKTPPEKLLSDYTCALNALHSQGLIVSNDNILLIGNGDHKMVIDTMEDLIVVHRFIRCFKINLTNEARLGD